MKMHIIVKTDEARSLNFTYPNFIYPIDIEKVEMRDRALDDLYDYVKSLKSFYLNFILADEGALYSVHYFFDEKDAKNVSRIILDYVDRVSLKRAEACLIEKQFGLVRIKEVF